MADKSCPAFGKCESRAWSLCGLRLSEGMTSFEKSLTKIYMIRSSRTRCSGECLKYYTDGLDEGMRELTERSHT